MAHPGESKRRPESGLARHAGALVERLAIIDRWYGGMVSKRTGRLVYAYEPESDDVVEHGSAIREIASIWNVALLGAFLGRSERRPLVDRSLEHYLRGAVARDRALVLDSEFLGEPSGIAHSAFLLLACLEAREASDASIVRLADGILRQQRADGSYRIYFDPVDDDGIEFYPGEAMLALMRTHERTGDARCLASVERGFASYRAMLSPESVSDDLLVFYANWSSQYAALLHEKTRDDELRVAVRDYVFALHDAILRTGFYDRVERRPRQQATVEVACALEGICDAYAIAVREHDESRERDYARAIRVALQWLLHAQRLERCTPRERGGFGHSMDDRTQRIDVTGHVASGFVKCAQNRIEP